jgi:hypothetical protein
MKRIATHARALLDESDCSAEFRVEVRSADARNHVLCSQASEGMWGMPGHTEARKAVVSCDKLGGVAHTR